MKKIILILVTLVVTVSFAQDSLDGTWTKKGTLSLIGNQSSFNNWVAGGDNAIGVNGIVNYDVNYKDDTWTWDNKFLLAYGLTQIGDDDRWKKTNDQLEINSLAGRKAWGENWYFSFFANVRTQFTDGYNYTKDINSDYRTSGFFAPGYVTFGPGLLWKKSDNLKVNIAPATSKLTVLSGEVFTHNGGTTGTALDWNSSDNFETFGVDPGKSTRYELGFYLSGYYKFNVMENVSMENILNLYSNYLEDPQNVDVDYTANVVMQINKYLSANATIQLLYDDNAFQGLQVRQLLGLGFNYAF